MGIQIIDSKGSGRGASVDINNRLETSGLLETIPNNAAFLGNAYNVNTGTVTLTSASKSAIYYFKNTGSNDVVIPALFYLLGNTTSGAATADHLIQVERNPTGGTIVTTATTQVPVNRNFASQNILTADSFSGVEAATLTGGTVAIESLFAGEGRQVLNVGALVLAKGNSIGVTVTPKTSNTNMDVQIAMAIYEVA